MYYLRRLTVTTITLLFLFTGVFYCRAAYPNDWYTVKTTVFRYAQEQDKYILLFVGVSWCDLCKNTHAQFTDPESPVKKMLDDNYIIWYSDDNNSLRRAENVEYSSVVRKMSNIYYPFIFIINPNIPGISVDSTWTPATTKLFTRVTPDVLVTNVDEFNAHYQNFLSLDLLSGSSLKWYKDQDQVFRLAKEQNKYVLKLEGRAGSNICRQVIHQLEFNPLKKLLDDNYILWYDEFDPAIRPGIKAPYLSVIYPNAPDITLDSTSGEQDVETLEELLQSYTVSNEKITSDKDNKVTVTGNVLQISNQVRNEQIRVFSLTGQQVASLRKNDYAVTFDASHFPRGVVIVSGSSGWSVKLLIN